MKRALNKKQIYFLNGLRIKINQFTYDVLDYKKLTHFIEMYCIQICLAFLGHAPAKLEEVCFLLGIEHGRSLRVCASLDYLQS